MVQDKREINWTPRVAKWKLRRLYETEAQGVYDDELINEIGTTLFGRCRDILTIHQARFGGQVRCQRCDRQGKNTFIPRTRKSRDEVLTCSQCGWSITWGQFMKSIRRKQLNAGGAVDVFRRFTDLYPRQRTPRDRLLAIDRLIHEFHYGIKNDPGRPVAVNLLVGKIGEVVAFLDELSGITDTPDITRTHQEWKAKYDSTPWPGFLGSETHRGPRSEQPDRTRLR